MKINLSVVKSSITAGLLLLSLGFMANAQAIPTTQQINILCTATEPCGQSTGTTADGTIFEADANPSSPSTGTGVFKPFVRIQEHTPHSETQSGYNTDTGEPAINFDTKASIWTHSVLFGDLGTVDIGGLSYYQFSLDSNESGKADSYVNLIDLAEIQIFLGGSDLMNPETNGGYLGTQFDGSAVGNTLAGYDPIWSLDNATNGDVTVTLQSSICDTPGQCGSGKGDLNVFILDSLLTGSADDYFSFYTEYNGADSGFEEWSYLDKTVPEPGMIGLLAIGLLGMVAARRRTKV